ncbi:MAG: ATP-dependent zinc metalloprotease FtsH [Acidimicrobiia bacterium]|nr:ATP-dependent zinc metalloprotease FtsH [Acidimicrobiia bacterium]
MWWAGGGIVVVAVLAATLALRSGDTPETIDLSELEALLADGEVETAEIRSGESVVEVEVVDGATYLVDYPGEFIDTLTTSLLDSGVAVTVDNSEPPIWQRMLIELAPIVVLVGVLAWIILSMQGGRGMGFGRNRARQHRRDQPNVTFDDVAGCPEAVDELREVTEFLKTPERFAAMGARVPRGVLLVGPPGTGKTLLARAVAGEAGVPFFSISGSDFVEMFVGVGASRVRGLFEQAKAEAPCIVFVDEIDAVGRHRGSGHGGGHDEREQTLNQLLVELDGFDEGSGVILVAATNRPDVLDPALLRPGRFDRQVVVDAPDLAGRTAILEVHGRGTPLDDAVDLELVARRTPGFTGADLANLVNEAALLATRRNLERIGPSEIGDAVDRVMAGPERRSKVMSRSETHRVAVHESGHALVGHLLEHTHPVHKVSIVARGRALGWTLALPIEDRYLTTSAELRDQLAMLLAGRAAEQLVLGDTSTGAADDLERASELARAMVTVYGMSDVVGPRHLGATEQGSYLGRDAAAVSHVSDQLAATVDAEVRSLLDTASAAATELLSVHRERLDALSTALVRDETIEDPDLALLLDGSVPAGSSHDSPGMVGDVAGRSGALGAREASSNESLSGVAHIVEHPPARPPRGVS